MAGLPKVFIGFDPGASGSMAILYEDNPAEVTVIDFKASGLYSYISLLKELINSGKYTIGAVVLEDVASMHGQGVKSVFSFGQRKGEIEGMLQTLELGYHLVKPQTWQKTIGANKKAPTKADKKKLIVDCVKRLYPSATSLLYGPKGGINDGRADAIGLACQAKVISLGGE